MLHEGYLTITTARAISKIGFRWRNFRHTADILNNAIKKCEHGEMCFCNPIT